MMSKKGNLKRKQSAFLISNCTASTLFPFNEALANTLVIVFTFCWSCSKLPTLSWSRKTRNCHNSTIRAWWLLSIENCLTVSTDNSIYTAWHLNLILNHSNKLYLLTCPTCFSKRLFTIIFIIIPLLQSAFPLLKILTKAVALKLLFTGVNSYGTIGLKKITEVISSILLSPSNLPTRR